MMYLKYPRRLSVSFKPEVYDFLKQESEYRQESMATLVREFTEYFFENAKKIGLVEIEDVQN